MHGNRLKSFRDILDKLRKASINRKHLVENLYLGIIISLHLTVAKKLCQENDVNHCVEHSF